LEVKWQGWGSSGGIVRAINSSEQSIRPRNQFVRVINSAEYSQSRLPEADVLAGIKGPRVGPGSALAGLGNQRAWVSDVGAERPPSAGRDERLNRCHNA